MNCLSDVRPRHAAIIKAFEDRATSYSRLAIVQRHLANWLAEWLEPPRIAAWQTALEFGAGDGLFTQFAADRYASYIATDIAPRMVQLGRRRLPHVTWQEADAWDSKGPMVDRLFSASLLQWCPTPEQVLRRWRDIVAPGGRMLHGFYVLPTLAEWYSVAPYRPPLEWHTANDWQRFFRKAGWRVLRCDCRTHSQAFPSALELVRFLRHTGATCGASPSIGDLRQQIVAYNREFSLRDRHGGVRSTWTMFRIEVLCR